MTGGPKNYAYTLIFFGSDGKLTQCKVRGIILSYANLQTINLETIQQMVHNIINQKGAKVTVTDWRKIARIAKTMNIFTKVVEKSTKLFLISVCYKDIFLYHMECNCVLIVTSDVESNTYAIKKS